MTGVHQSGRHVIVSNRGHESIAIFRVKQCCGSKGKAMRGTLAKVGFFHTRGETPRHFQFDHSGQFLIVANQDSDTIAVFSFCLTSGKIKYTGNEYHIPSPNFICKFLQLYQGANTCISNFLKGANIGIANCLVYFCPPNHQVAVPSLTGTRMTMITKLMKRLDTPSQRPKII